MYLRVFLFVALLLGQMQPTSAAVKTGDKCSKVGVIAKSKITSLICVKSGKINRWEKVKQTPAPTPSPTVTKKPEPTYLERWKSTGSQALIPFDATYLEQFSQFKKIDLIWKISDRVPNEIRSEIQARYAATSTFWSSHTKFDFPLQVIVGNLDDIEFICTWRSSHLGISKDNCNTSFRQDKTRDWDAHTTQFGDRATDFYFMSDPKTLNSPSFIPRVEHEFFHNVQFAQMRQYKSVMPCWAEEGGAEYFGVLLSSNGNAERFLKLRSLSVSASMGKIRSTNSSSEFWKNWLFSTDMTSVVPKSSSWGCEPASMEGIYHQGLLATEYLHLKFGIAGLLNLYRNAGSQGWDRAIESTFNKSKAEAYAEIAEYANREYLIVKNESWAIPNCRQTCTNL